MFILQLFLNTYIIIIVIVIRRTDKNDILLGVNGRHAINTRSIHFFDEIGIDYVSIHLFK